jgi:hypothetical protein
MFAEGGRRVRVRTFKVLPRMSPGTEPLRVVVVDAILLSAQRRGRNRRTRQAASDLSRQISEKNAERK